MLGVNDFKGKIRNNPGKNYVEDYVNHFSQAADFLKESKTQNSAAYNFA